MRMVKITALALVLALGLTGCGAAAAQEAVRGDVGTGEEFSLELLSTGKSDCALIRMDGLWILSDAADRDDLAAIQALLQKAGAEKLDYLVLSHFDKDHIGAAAGVLESVAVGEILSPDYEESSEEYYALEIAAEEKAVPWTRLTEARTIETENGQILLDPPDGDYGDDNNNSLLMVLTWRGQQLVFLGDAEKQRMKEFQSFAETEGLYELPWAFVKLPHHGDSCKPLIKVLQQAKPAWAAETVSVFEAVETGLTDALTEMGTRLFLTRDGEVRIAWDGEKLTVEQEKRSGVAFTSTPDLHFSV